MIPTIHIGKVSISTYWLMLAIGTIAMFACIVYRKKRFSLKIWECAFFTVFLTIIGLCGAKLLFILENIESTLRDGISLGGVSFFGSIFLIPLLMPIAGRIFGLRRDETMDICGPCVAIMIGCMRVGCFFSSCCGGWEMCLGNFCFNWPTQAIESICDFAILGFLLQYEEQEQHKGILYPFFMVFYSGMRFFVEFLRDTPKDWLFMSHGQWFAIISVAIGLSWIYVARIMGQKYDEKTKKIK